MSGELVLVTGGSGFIASHCILQLLNAGYRVRTTLRSLDREAEVRRMIAAGGADPRASLSFVAADLTADEGWPEALAGCAYVLHVASPFPLGVPKDEDELIVPAREGALRVLRAARDAGVKRVVLTSSFAAVGYGKQPAGRSFTEKDWTDPEAKGIGAYVKSKTIAEHAAWDFIANEGGTLELSVVNPVGVFGPLLGPDYSTSIEIVRRLLDGEVPGIPNLSFGVVDVRDVVDLHLRAMTDPAANGERFLAVAGESVTMQEMARILRHGTGGSAGHVPSRAVPDWIVRIASLFDSSLKQVVGELGKIKNASNEKARRLLGWTPRSNKEALIATAESVIALGLLHNTK